MPIQARPIHLFWLALSRLNGDVLLAGALALTAWIVILAAIDTLLRLT